MRLVLPLLAIAAYGCQKEPDAARDAPATHAGTEEAEGAPAGPGPEVKEPDKAPDAETPGPKPPPPPVPDEDVPAVLQDGRGPNSWTPPADRPAFRELIEGDEYTRRLAAALEKINVAALEDSTLPVAGLEITKVRKGGPADRLGIRKGDFFLALDGRPLAFKWQFNPMREWREQMLLVHHADGRREELRIRPGKIGTWFWPHWAPELEYLRRKERDVRLDGEMLVGLTRFKEDPLLAETALHHAVKKGYEPDALTDGVGAELAATFARQREALDFAWLALQGRPDRAHRDDGGADLRPVRVRAANMFIETAMASFNIDRGLVMLRKFPTLIVNDMGPIEKLVAEWRLRSAVGGTHLPPTVLAARKLRRNVLAMAEPLNPVAGTYIPYLARGGAHLSPPAGKHIPVVFGPCARDVEMTLSFKARPKQHKTTPCYFAIGWADMDFPAFDEARRCPHFHGGFALEIGEGRSVTVCHHVRDIDNSRVFHDVYLDYERENFVHMAVYGGQCEALLNGHRIFYGPFPSEVKRLVPVLKAVSMEVGVTGIAVSSLGESVEAEEDDGEVF
jgi:hypothetical protein